MPALSLSLQRVSLPLRYQLLLRPASRLFCAEGGEGYPWNLKGLKSEISRKALRLFKKTVQANDRLSKAKSIDTPSMEDSDSSLELLQIEAALYSEQLKEVKKLEESIANIKSASDPLFADLLPIIHKFNITDTPPQPQPRGPKKAKNNTPTGPRKPYNVFTSVDKIEIRVGRRAEDNDELSCNPEYRDGADWWLHVAGHPGSHVVIRCHDDDLPVKYKETLKDAAVLAAKNSKAPPSNAMQVTYTRCRNVSKPAGAKPGLVYLKGEVATIRVNLKVEKDRLSRLEEPNMSSASTGNVE